MLGSIGQAERSKQFFSAHVAVLTRHTGIDRRHFHVLQGSGVADQVVALKHETERLAAQARQFVAIERGDIRSHEAVLPAGRTVETADEVHQGGLARAGCAHDGDEFARIDLQTHAMQHFDRKIAVAIGLADADQFDQRNRALADLAFQNGEIGFHRLGRIRRCSRSCGARSAGLSCFKPTATTSPGSNPDRICAETRFITPTFTARSSTEPS